MDSTDVCPNCGKSIPCEDHRCLPNEGEVINQMDDSDDSTPFLDKIVKESESFDESASTSVEKDFIEELEKNSLKRTEGKCDSFRLPSLKKDPVISEGNPPSPPEEEKFAEEIQKDAIEEILALRENFENDPEFLSIERSLHSNELGTILLLQGNPLDELPFQPLISDESRDSIQNKYKNLESANACKRRDVRSDAATAKTGPDSGLVRKSILKTTSKDDCDRLKLGSLVGSHEQQNTSEGNLMVLPSVNQASSSRKDRSRHSKSKSMKSTPKHSPEESFPRDKGKKTFTSKDSYVHHMISHEHRITSEESPIDLSVNSQIYPSTPGPSRHSDTESKNSSLKHTSKGSLSRRHGGKSSSKEYYADHRLWHGHQNTSESSPVALPCGSQDDPSRPGPSGYTRTASKNSPLKRSSNWSFPCDECGRELASMQTLKAHKILHSVKPHVCKNCGESFAFKSFLNHHIRTLTGERHYKCKECGRKFTQSSDLNKHYRTHTSNEPYKCDVCGQIFVYKSLSCKHCRRHTT